MALRKLSHEEIARTPVGEIGGVARHPVVLVVDNVRSLYNVGSIFRSCDGACAEKLYLCGFTPHPPRSEIEKTALGATASVPWEYARDVAKVLRALKREGKTIAALEHTDSSIPSFSLARGRFPLAVVVGNEITGVSESALSECDLAIEIPMYGVKQSLNVAVAAGIVLYDCVRTLRAAG